MQQSEIGPLEAGFLAQKYDPLTDRVLLVRLGEAEIKAASFLDDRILKPGMDGFWTTINQAASRATPKPVAFIFHAGHTGSTLLSRLLATTDVLPIREPLALRTLADIHDGLGTAHALFGRADFQYRLDTFLDLWSRGFADVRKVLIKATSTAGRIAPALLDARPAAKAVYMTLKPESYIATLLAGANAMIDLRGHAQERNRRLERTLGEAPLVLHRASAGDLAAMAWLAEALAQHAALRHAPDRVMAIDFDAMLSDLDRTLRAAADHVGVAMPDAGTIAAIMGRYSKGPEHSYSPGLRSQVLAQARRDHASELRKGLEWLERSAARHPAVADVLAAA